ncbi:MAG TPA: hypothetical protein VK832_04200, partial [Burkholderiaceae bacterium]|nr:hypothetical protein [Burkholderiaceae bacterium]
MPLAFIILGILLIVTAYQGTYAAFGQQLYTDFSGGAGSNFIYWVAAVAMIGALGYVSPLRTPTRLLLALIIIAFFLANKGVWSNLTSAFG